MWFHGEPPSQRAPAAMDCRRRTAWYAGPQYPGLARWFTPARNGGLVQSTSRMMTVLEFNAAARSTALAAAKSGVPVYLYYFTWAPPGDPWGAMHGAELSYAFDSPLASSPGASGYTAEQMLAAEVSGYWTAFAATGDPNGQGRPQWPRFAAGPHATLEIGAPTKVITGPYLAACRIANGFTMERGPAPLLRLVP
jgi:carboxylesterase type B